MNDLRAAWRPDKDVDHYVYWDAFAGESYWGSRDKLASAHGRFGIERYLDEADSNAINYNPHKMYPAGENTFIMARDLDIYWNVPTQSPMYFDSRFVATGVGYEFAIDELNHGCTLEHFLDVDDFFKTRIWAGPKPPRNAHNEMLLERLRIPFRRYFGDNWLGWASMVWRFDGLHSQNYSVGLLGGLTSADDPANTQHMNRIRGFANAFSKYDWKNIYLLMNAIEPRFRISFTETQPVELIADALEKNGWENIDTACAMLNADVDFWLIPDYLDAGIDASLAASV